MLHASSLVISKVKGDYEPDIPSNIPYLYLQLTVSQNYGPQPYWLEYMTQIIGSFVEPCFEP